MRRQRPALVAVGAVVSLAGCGGPLLIAAPELDAEAAGSCRSFVGALPDSVGDQERREVEGETVAAYGDPPIVVRCGVPRPAELISNCLRVNGVDWYLSDVTDKVVALTVGREPSVEVQIPDAYGTSSAALVDVGDAVMGATERTQPCG